MLGTIRASGDKVVVGAVSLMVETIHMGMTMMGGTNTQVIGMEGVVCLLVMGMAHSWEEEVDHPYRQDGARSTQNIHRTLLHRRDTG